MLMNKVETHLVTNPANRVFQRCVEAPILRRLGGRTPGARALEIGCGSGYGTKLIIDQFGAATVDAIDLDPAMVTRARRRLRRYRDQVHVMQGSADDLRAALGACDATYDAAFDLGVTTTSPTGATPWPRSPASCAPAAGSTISRSPPRRSRDPATGDFWTTRPRTGSPPARSSPPSGARDSSLPRVGAPTSAVTISSASRCGYDQRKTVSGRGLGSGEYRRATPQEGITP